MAAKKSNKARAVQPNQRAQTTVAVDPQSPTPPPSPIRRPMPWFGWVGLGIIIVNHVALWARVHPANVTFTAFIWTGYILLLDGWIWARGHKSYFKDEKLQWPMLALFSILIWVMFEAFNFPLKAWWYEHRPLNFGERELLYAWAYATIIPAMLRTRSLFNTFDLFHHTHPRWKIQFTPFLLAVCFVLGIAFTFIPLMMDYPASNPNPFIVFMWLGLIFLIEPINYRLGAPSVFHDLERGKISFLLQLLAAGLVCGLLWESLNQQVVWHDGFIWRYNINHIYHICIGGSGVNCTGGYDVKIGQMPILGFLGYPPFIWECFALWELCKWALQGDRLWKSANK
jgi:hypothetical protein